VCPLGMLGQGSMDGPALTAGRLKAALAVEFEYLRRQLKEDVRLALEQCAPGPGASEGFDPPLKQGRLGKPFTLEPMASVKKQTATWKEEEGADFVLELPGKPLRDAADSSLEKKEAGRTPCGETDFDLEGSPNFELPSPSLKDLADADAHAVEDQPAVSLGRTPLLRVPTISRSVALSSLQTPSRLVSVLKHTQHEVANEAQRAMGLVPGKSSRSTLQEDDDSISHSRLYLAKVVQSSTFEIATILIIVAYGLQVGFQTEYMAMKMLATTPTSYRIAEIIFLGVFILELLLRLYVHRRHFFTMYGWGWNVFDFVLVLMQLVEEVLLAIWPETAEGLSSFPASPVLRLAKIFRMLRIARLLRLITLLSDLRLLVTCIVHSLKSFYWVMVLLGLMIYIVSLYCTHMIRDIRVKLEVSNPAHAALDSCYGSVTRSMLCLFQGLTGGLDWNELVDPMVRYVGPFSAIILVLWIAFALIAVLNVVTGTFVENAIAQAQRIKEVQRMEQAKLVFKCLDVDASGCLGFEELEGQLSHPEVRDYLTSIEMDESQALFLFKMLDINGSGSIDFLEFISGCHRLQGTAKTVDVMLIMRDTKDILEALKGVMREVEMLQAQMNHLISR